MKKYGWIVIVAGLVFLGVGMIVIFGVSERTKYVEQSRAEDRAMVEKWFNEYLTDMKNGQSDAAKNNLLERSNTTIKQRVETWTQTIDPILCSVNLPESLKVTQVSEEEYMNRTYRREYFIQDASSNGTSGTYAVYDETAPALVSIYCKV